MINLNNFIFFENLKTHDADKLQNQIKKYFPNIEFEFNSVLSKRSLKNKYDNKSFLLSCDELSDINKLKKDKNFDDLLHFYNYYITKEFYDTLVISPLYAENVNDLVNKNEYLYHFTTGNNAKSILQNGLRIKMGESYRYFPKRIYLYSTNKEITLDKNLPKRFINKIINKNDKDNYGLTILKIDKDKLSNIDFYTDDYMEEKESVYIYNNIPSEYIEKV